MSSKAEDRKVDVVLLWYKKEVVGFTIDKKKKILNTWIDLCAEEEEYILAAALKDELDVLKKIEIEDREILNYIKRRFKIAWRKIKSNGFKKNS